MARCALLGVVFVQAACAKIAGVEPWPGEAQSSTSAASSAAAGGMGAVGGVGGAGATGAVGGQGGTGGRPAPCETAPLGPALVNVGAYCIDETEVTREQYQAWLDLSPQTATQPAYCAFNTDFTPTVATGDSDAPVTGVDWCDAEAFCAAATKRLCGSLEGGPTEFENGWTDAMKSAWFAACTQGGLTEYPYGSMYNQTACNGGEASGLVKPVKTLVDCRGSMPPWNGVYDLSGNAAEWEDSCDAYNGEFDLCHRRGGGAGNLASEHLACDGEGVIYTRHENTPPDLGFRCCADLAK